MKVTIKRIAELSGVSIGTVDRALHNRSGVSPDTKARVEKIVAELGYKSNLIGKALVHGKNPITIGIIILSEEMSYYCSQMKKGIDKGFDEIEDFGIKAKFYFIHSFEPQEILDVLNRAKMDNLSGLIIRPINNDKIKATIDSIVSKGIPVITCSWDIPNSNRLCFVGQNDYKEGRIAANLLEKIIGTKGKLGILCSSQSVLAQKKKIEGIEDYIKERELDIDIVDVIETKNKKSESFESAIHLLNSHDDITAMAVLTACFDEVYKAVNILERKNLCIFQFGDSKPAEKYLKEGVLDFVIQEDAVMNGYKAVRVLFEYLFYNRKFEGDKIIIESVIKVMENIDI